MENHAHTIGLDLLIGRELPGRCLGSSLELGYKAFLNL